MYFSNVTNWLHCGEFYYFVHILQALYFTLAWTDGRELWFLPTFLFSFFILHSVHTYTIFFRNTFYIPSYHEGEGIIRIFSHFTFRAVAKKKEYHQTVVEGHHQRRRQQQQWHTWDVNRWKSLWLSVMDLQFTPSPRWNSLYSSSSSSSSSHIKTIH